MEELKEQLQGKICMVDKFSPIDDSFCVYRNCLSSGDERATNYGMYISEYDDATYLSPIQERSEPSSSEGGMGGIGMERVWSQSCHEMSVPERLRPDDDLENSRSQTYPRSHADETVAEYNQREYTALKYGFPLEPREIDPDMFFQLHTADSQDELQEFLLLESQCGLSSNDGGLHAAFVEKPNK